jgi:DtxR family transcriptional regulator, Mn-dependent transcriptional regulator
MDIDKERIDEALELLWVLNEEGHQDLNRFRLSSEDDEVDSIINVLKTDGFVITSGDNIQFTDKGRSEAKALIRRLRLAERLFTDVFEMRDDTVLADACKMEHILSEELTDSVCTFLGHPQTCPHGKPIPRGECCKKYKVEVEPVVTRLSEFEVGLKGRITFIVPTKSSRLSKLSSLGITAGSVIRLLQRKPSYVIQADETTVAIDPEIAKEIYVKKTA